MINEQLTLTGLNRGRDMLRDPWLIVRGNYRLQSVRKKIHLKPAYWRLRTYRSVQVFTLDDTGAGFALPKAGSLRAKQLNLELMTLQSRQVLYRYEGTRRVII